MKGSSIRFSLPAWHTPSISGFVIRNARAKEARKIAAILRIAQRQGSMRKVTKLAKIDSTMRAMCEQRRRFRSYWTVSVIIGH